MKFAPRSGKFNPPQFKPSNPDKMKTLSPVARAANSGPFKSYLMGYVAGIIYHDGGQWLLNRAGGWADERHDAQKDMAAHIWPTFEQAEAVARRVHSDKFPAFVRAYTYSTPNPANAAGMAPIETARDSLFL